MIVGQVREAIQRERNLRASRAIAKNGASGTSIPVSNSDSIAVGTLEDYHVPDRAAFNGEVWMRALPYDSVGQYGSLSRLFLTAPNRRRDAQFVGRFA